MKRRNYQKTRGSFLNSYYRLRTLVKNAGLLISEKEVEKSHSNSTVDHEAEGMKFQILFNNFVNYYLKYL